MSERGTFIVDRGLFGHPVFADEPFTEREAWMWLISEAAFKPYRRRVGKVIVDLKRGQLAHSLRHMATTWKWTVARVRRYLSKLEEGRSKIDPLIGTATDAGVTLVTICNYDSYQLSSTKSDVADGTQSGTAAAQQRHKEEEKEVSKKEIGIDARAREATGSISPEAHALGSDFLTAIGVDPKNPELSGMAGAPYAAAMWITRGYDHALILATAADIAARYGPNKPLTYYTKCFDTAHRKAKAEPEREFPLLRTVEGGNATVKNRAYPIARSFQPLHDPIVAGMARVSARRAAQREPAGPGNDEIPRRLDPPSAIDAA